MMGRKQQINPQRYIPQEHTNIPSQTHHSQKTGKFIDDVLFT